MPGITSHRPQHCLSAHSGGKRFGERPHLGPSLERFVTHLAERCLSEIQASTELGILAFEVGVLREIFAGHVSQSYLPHATTSSSGRGDSAADTWQSLGRRSACSLASMTDVESAGSGEEVDRLRSLVGPSETAYASLRADRDAAQAAAKSAMAESGQLRGRIEEMSVQLSRARQDQDLLQRRAAMTPLKRAIDSVRRRWTTSVAPRLGRLVERARPS